MRAQIISTNVSPKSAPAVSSVSGILPDEKRRQNSQIIETADVWSALEGVNPSLVAQMLEHAREGDWEGFLCRVNAPFRFTVLNAIKDFLTPPDFWKAFAYAWMHCENAWEDTELIQSLLASPRGTPQQMMDAKEKEALARLPDVIPIYRGATLYNIFGISWTLSRRKAEWFAANRQVDPLTFCFWAKCNKGDVLGLLLERQEKEIVVFPQNVKILNAKRIPDSEIHPSSIFTIQFARSENAERERSLARNDLN